MNIIIDIIMVGLFILILAFIFSTSLLTPIIGKKNLIFVLLLGLTVGAVGGAFFIAPVTGDIPAVARSVFMATTSGTDIVGINVSSEVNVTNFVKNTKNIDGVKDVQSNGITIKTAGFSDAAKSEFLSRIPSLNSNITSVSIPSNNTIIIQVKNNTDPYQVITLISNWLMLVSGVVTDYSVIRVTAEVESSKYDQIMAQIPQNEVVITDISGPSEKNIQYSNSLVPSTSSVIFVCGLIGMLTGLAGVFIESINSWFGNIQERFKRLKK